jgi:fructose-1,6-bisphosphatase/inositol monophosphatase family enzyme
MAVGAVLLLVGAASGALLGPVANWAGPRRHPPARAAVEVAGSPPAAAWAAEHAGEAAAAALAVQRAMRLCEALACDMQMVAADPTGGKTMDACDVAAGVALIKAGDSTPVRCAWSGGGRA